MKTKNIAAVSTILSALLLSSTAFAASLAETYPDTVVQTTAVKTRAQVVAELVQAEAAGQLPLTEGNYNIAANAQATQYAAGGKTRAQVVAELRQSLSDGTYVAPSEAEVIPTTRLAGSARSRSEVRAEAIQSAQANRSYAVRTN
jgi:hypothetical protein